MNIEEQGLISEGSHNDIEFTKAEEVGEFGEHARKEKMTLPHQFDISDKEMKARILEKASQIMQEKDFDTFIITCTSYEDFLFTVVNE